MEKKQLKMVVGLLILVLITAFAIVKKAQAEDSREGVKSNISNIERPLDADDAATNTEVKDVDSNDAVTANDAEETSNVKKPDSKQSGKKIPKKSKDKKDDPKKGETDEKDTASDKSVEDPEKASVSLSVSCVEERKYSLGETVVFEEDIKNTGNVKLILNVSNVEGKHRFALEPGEMICNTSTTTVTEQDIIDGFLVDDVSVAYGTKTEESFAIARTVPVDRTLVIDEQWSDPKNGIDYEPDEEIFVTVTVTNAGNVTQNYAHVHSDGAGCEWVIRVISPGETVTLTTSFVKDPNYGRYINGDEEGTFVYGDEDDPVDDDGFIDEDEPINNDVVGSSDTVDTVDTVNTVDTVDTADTANSVDTNNTVDNNSDSDDSSLLPEDEGIEE